MKHAWSDLDKQAELYSNKTISEDPDIAKKYLEILETYDLKNGQIFAAFSIHIPQQTYFAAVYSSPDEIVYMKGKKFKLKNRLRIGTKTKGIQAIWFYEEV
jgi:hypothetical protein